VPCPPVSLPIVDAGPEALFRIGQVHAVGEVVRGSMPIGSSTRGADGRTSAGALGVLVDNVLGYAIIAARPPDHWSVSTEISLDVFPELRTATGRLHAEATTIHTDALGGFATGRVVDDVGMLVAVCGQRGRFVPTGAGALGPPSFDREPGAVADVGALLGIGGMGDEGADLIVSPELQNPMRNLHGGIVLAVADLVAAACLRATDGPELVTASLHATYTRPLPGGSVVSFRPHVRHRGRGLAVVEVTGTVEGRVGAVVRVVAQRLP